MKKFNFHISWKDIFLWKGTRNRLGYLHYFLCLKLIAVLINVLEIKVHNFLIEAEFPLICYIVPNVFFLLLGIFMIYLFFCNNTKRMHDLGFKTVWGFLVTLFLEISYMAICLFTPAQKANHKILYYILLYSILFIALCLFCKKGKPAKIDNAETENNNVETENKTGSEEDLSV